MTLFYQQLRFYLGPLTFHVLCSHSLASSINFVCTHFLQVCGRLRSIGLNW